MRRFRAIVESKLEPQDKEVLWYYKHKLLYWGNDTWEPFLIVDAFEVPYKTEEDKSIATVEDALDKLLYVKPEIVEFNIDKAGFQELGSSISPIVVSWKYNKDQKFITSQIFNGQSIPNDISRIEFTSDISEDIHFSLVASDGITDMFSELSIRFVNFIYWGTLTDTETQRYKQSFLTQELEINAAEGEHVWVFIPETSGLTTIWHNNINVTEDFEKQEVSFMVDTNLQVPGTYYKSKWDNLGKLTLKLT